jgi:hypothetical protein
MLRNHTTPILISFLLTLTACGGGESTGTSTANSTASAQTTIAQTTLGSTTLKNDPTCAIQYAINDSPELSGPDPMLNRQWHLKNTGQKQGTVGEDMTHLKLFMVI